MIKFFRTLGGNRDGISSVEYALLLAFVAIGVIMFANALDDKLSAEMSRAAECIEGDVDACSDTTDGVTQ